MQGADPPKSKNALSEEQRREPLRKLLEASLVEKGRPETEVQEIADLSWSTLRERLLAVDPLSKDWVVKVNQVSCLLLSFLP